jgi:transcription factor C subunit 6
VARATKSKKDTRPPEEIAAEKEKEARNRDGGGAWPYEVGVHRAAWNSGSGIQSSPLLASGMFCGLCRIDWLPGRFYGDRVPYNDVETLRGERDGVIDDQEEVSDDE